MATGGELRDVIQRQAGPFIHRAGLAVQGGIQKTSPVKKGTLRRGWTTSQPAWKGTRLLVKVGNKVWYVRDQNERSRNRGFIKRGYDSAKEQAKAQIEQGLHAIRDAFWVKR